MKLLRRMPPMLLGLLLAFSAYAVDIGTTTIGGSQRSMNDTMRGHLITMPTGTFAAGVTVSCYVRDPTSSGTEWTASIWAADGSTLAVESAVRTNITTAAWYTFSGGTLATFTPAASTQYYVMCGNEADADADIAHAAGTGQNATITQVNPTTQLAPPIASDARDYSLYMTYSLASSGGLLLRRRRQ